MPSTVLLKRPFQMVNLSWNRMDSAGKVPPDSQREQQGQSSAILCWAVLCLLANVSVAGHKITL